MPRSALGPGASSRWRSCSPSRRPLRRAWSTTCGKLAERNLPGGAAGADARPGEAPAARSGRCRSAAGRRRSAYLHPPRPRGRRHHRARGQRLHVGEPGAPGPRAAPGVPRAGDPHPRPGGTGVHAAQPARARACVWREGGMVYWLATSTRQVTPADLRTTASSLDPLEQAWRGSGGDPELDTSAILVTTTPHRDRRRRVGRALHQRPTGASRPRPRASVEVNLLPRSGDRFSFSLAGRNTGSVRWSGEVSGTVAADAITLNVRATATVEGAAVRHRSGDAAPHPSGVGCRP